MITLLSQFHGVLIGLGIDVAIVAVVCIGVKLYYRDKP